MIRYYVEYINEDRIEDIVYLYAPSETAVESMMKVLVNSSDRDLEDLLKAERQAVKENSGTKDSQEGMAAFMEKRKPIFNK